MGKDEQRATTVSQHYTITATMMRLDGTNLLHLESVLKSIEKYRASECFFGSSYLVRT